MEKGESRIGVTLSAVIAAAAVLFSTLLLSIPVSNSAFFQKSRFVRMILATDSVGISGLVANTAHVDVLIKFLGAVTTAYINFERIPVNEASTFAAIFESLTEVDGTIGIESFSYQGRAIIITGTADTEQACEAFLAGLSEQKHFSAVSGHKYTTTEDNIRFEIECTT